MQGQKYFFLYPLPPPQKLNFKNFLSSPSFFSHPDTHLVLSNNSLHLNVMGGKTFRALRGSHLPKVCYFPIHVTQHCYICWTTQNNSNLLISKSENSVHWNLITHKTLQNASHIFSIQHFALWNNFKQHTWRNNF